MRYLLIILLAGCSAEFESSSEKRIGFDSFAKYCEQMCIPFGVKSLKREECVCQDKSSGTQTFPAVPPKLKVEDL